MAKRKGKDSPVRRLQKQTRASLCCWGWARHSLKWIKEPLIGWNLQVAATRQDQEDLWVVDWQQYTARREDDHDDIERMATFGLIEKARAGWKKKEIKSPLIHGFKSLVAQNQSCASPCLWRGGSTQLQAPRAVCALRLALSSLSGGGCYTVLWVPEPEWWWF